MPTENPRSTDDTLLGEFQGEFQGELEELEEAEPPQNTNMYPSETDTVKIINPLLDPNPLPREPKEPTLIIVLNPRGNVGRKSIPVKPEIVLTMVRNGLRGMKG